MAAPIDELLTKPLTEPVPIPSLHDAESARLSARLVELARELATCDGVDAFAATGWLPDAFFAILAELYAAYDAFIAHRISASRLEIVCRAGCSRCCHQAVHGVFAFEIINLYRSLRPLDDYRALHGAFAGYAAQFQSTVEQIAEGGDAGDPVQHAVDAFAAAALPCPLLADDRCRVHADRPAACRMYHSLTQPVLCTTGRGKNFNIELPSAVNEILWSLSDRLVFPFPTFLAQGMVTFAAARGFRPWNSPE